MKDSAQPRVQDRPPTAVPRSPPDNARRGLSGALWIAVLLTVLTGWLAAEGWIRQIHRQNGLYLQEQLRAVSWAFGVELFSPGEEPPSVGAGDRLRSVQQRLDRYARLSGIQSLRILHAGEPLPPRPSGQCTAVVPIYSAPERDPSFVVRGVLGSEVTRGMVYQVRRLMAACTGLVLVLLVPLPS